MEASVDVLSLLQHILGFLLSSKTQPTKILRSGGSLSLSLPSLPQEGSQPVAQQPRTPCIAPAGLKLVATLLCEAPGESYSPALE